MKRFCKHLSPAFCFPSFVSFSDMKRAAQICWSLRLRFSSSLFLLHGFQFNVKHKGTWTWKSDRSQRNLCKPSLYSGKKPFSKLLKNGFDTSRISRHRNSPVDQLEFHPSTANVYLGNPLKANTLKDEDMNQIHANKKQVDRHNVQSQTGQFGYGGRTQRYLRRWRYDDNFPAPVFIHFACCFSTKHCLAQSRGTKKKCQIKVQKMWFHRNLFFSMIHTKHGHQHGLFSF